jgi:cytochrome b561
LGQTVVQFFNSPTRYGVIAQCLHWGAVVLVLLAWTLGILGDELPRGPTRALGLYIHVTAGLLIIVLTFLRLLWRLVDPSPPAEKNEFGEWLFADWIGLGAKLAHFLLYVLLLAVPVVGVVLQFARGDSLSIFGLVEIASPWVRDKPFAESVKEVHELLAHCLLAVAGLHAVAALVHHWVFADRTLVRMLPGSKQ